MREKGRQKIITGFRETARGSKFSPWLSLARKVYLAITDWELPVLYTEAGGGKRISAKRAVFPDPSFEQSTGLTKALMGIQLPVVDVPGQRCVSKSAVSQSSAPTDNPLSGLQEEFWGNGIHGPYSAILPARRDG